MGSQEYMGVNPQVWIGADLASDPVLQQGARAIQQLQGHAGLVQADVTAIVQSLGERIGPGRTVSGEPAEKMIKSLYYHSPSAREQGEIILSVQPDALAKVDRVLRDRDARNLLGARLGPENADTLLAAMATSDVSEQNELLAEVVRNVAGGSRGGAIADAARPRADADGVGGGGRDDPPPAVGVAGDGPDESGDLINAIRQGNSARIAELLARAPDRASLINSVAAEGERIRPALQSLIKAETEPGVRGFVKEAARAINMVAPAALAEQPVAQRDEVRSGEAQQAEQSLDRARLKAMVMSQHSNFASLSSDFPILPNQLNLGLRELLISELSV